MTSNYFILLGLLFFLLGGTGCTPPVKKCTSIIIEDSDYFSTDQVLSDHCEGVDYIIKNGPVYDALDVDGNLVIEDGVTIQFEAGGGLVIEDGASIKTKGSAAKGITLHGPDPTATGDWRGLIIYSGNASNSLQYTTIKGGGSTSFNSNGEKGNVIIYADAKVAIDHCTFQNSKSYGINANYYTNVELLSFTNNKFIGNETPLLVRADFVDKIDKNNSFEGNTNSYVHVRVGQEIRTSTTWQALDIPYRLTAKSGGIFPIQEIDNSAELTLEPGMIFEFEAGTGLKIDDNAALYAVGTAAKPILFKGSNSTAGYWEGLYFSRTGNPLNQLTHVTIDGAGSKTTTGALAMWARPTLRLNTVKISNVSGGCSIYDSNGITAGLPSNPNYMASTVVFENVNSQYCD
ncbi:MAG: hypothetical protein ACRBFS_17840 [Aureispira sp.]